MMGLMSGSMSLPVMVGQVFGDIGGFLTGVEFLASLANLITTLLTSFIADLLFGMLGTGA